MLKSKSKRLMVCALSVFLCCLMVSSTFADSIEAFFNSINIMINGEKVASVGQSMTLDDGTEVPYSINYNGVTYVPLKYVMDVYDNEIIFDSYTKTVYVDDSGTNRVLTDTSSTNTSVLNHDSTNETIIQITKEVDRFIKADDFVSAMNLLVENKEHDQNDILKKQADEVETAWDLFLKDRLLKIKPQIDIQYDEIARLYYIATKGQTPKGNSISEEINIDARISVSIQEQTNVVGMLILVGFVREDWLFMNKVIIASDEDRFEWKFTSADRETDVGNGQILEYCIKEVMHPSIPRYSETNTDIEAKKLINEFALQNYMNCDDLIISLSQSKNKVIRFIGKNDSFDHIISEQEMFVLSTLYEVLEILTYNPSLIEYITD